MVPIVNVSGIYHTPYEGDNNNDGSSGTASTPAVERAPVDEMAARMLKQLGFPDAAKPKGKAKAKAKAVAKAGLKKPAAATPPKKETSCLKKCPSYPGTERQKPIHWGGCTIYTSDTKWRVKLHRGDKKDVPVSFSDEPKKAWQRVLKLCRERGDAP